MNAALAQKRVNFPGVAANVVFAQDVHGELGLVRRVVKPMMFLNTPLLAMRWPADWLTPL